MHFDPEAFGAAMGELIAEAVTPLKARIADLEKQLADAPDVAAMVAEAVGALPKPTDGKSITVDDVRPVVDEAIERVRDEAKQAIDAAIEAIPVPRDGLDGKDGVPGKDGEKGDPGADGVGLAGAMIDREGALVVTMTNGEVRSLGPVVGKEGAPGKDGLDGLGFDDMAVEQDEDGRVTLRFVRGEVKKEFALRFPVFVDRGTFKEGETYERGSGVSWGGSFWIARKAGELGKPGTGDDWRLAVKKGRDGRDGEKGERGEKGDPGRSWVKTDDLGERS